MWRSVSTLLLASASDDRRSAGGRRFRPKVGDLPIGGETAGGHEHGSRKGFDDLYGEHYLGAYRLALLLCSGEAALAEDAVSEAFAHVYPKWQAGRVADFGPYLRRAVANQVKVAFRHRAVERREEQRQRGDDRGALPFDEHLGHRDALWRALRMLPLKQRTAVALHYYEDRSLKEVAEAMGTTLGTAKAHLSRGRDRLRELLGMEGIA